MSDNAQNAPVDAQEALQRTQTPSQVGSTANASENAPRALNEADLTARVKRLEGAMQAFMGQLTSFMESVNGHTTNVQASSADVAERMQALSDRVERLAAAQEKPAGATPQLDATNDVRASLQSLVAADNNRNESVVAALGGFNDQFTKFLSDVAHTVDGIRMDANQQLTSLTENTTGTLQAIVNKIDSLANRVNEIESQASDRHEQVMARTAAPRARAKADVANAEDKTNG